MIWYLPSNGIPIMNDYRRLSKLIFLWLLILSLILPHSLIVSAEVDNLIPTINHEPFKGEIVQDGSGYTITAVVKDNDIIQSVTLYYRTAGEKSYQSSPMRKEAGQQYQYGITLAPSAIHDPGIEYYIQTKDRAGNSALRGFSFSPMKVAVSAKKATGKVADAVNQKLPLSEGKKKGIVSGARKWWWFAGITVVALVAAGSGGGGSSSGSDPQNDEEGTLSINVPIR